MTYVHDIDVVCSAPRPRPELYLPLMAWIMRKKRIADLRPGDKLVDENGQVTVVESKTEAKTPAELYELLLQTDDGSRLTVRADGDHLWPLDPSKPGSLPPDYTGETEADSRTISEWTAAGWQPVLAPLAGADGTAVSWTIRSCSMLSAGEAASSRVQCVKVDSPTHTFLVASPTSGDSESARAVATALAGDDTGVAPATLAMGDGVTLVDGKTFDSILKQSVPTHNCGGPLTLDTPLMLANGGTVAMGDVRPGMSLVSATGEATMVLSTSPVMVPERLFELGFEPDDDAGLPEWTPELLAAAESASRSVRA